MMQETEGIKCLRFEIAGKAYIVPQSVVAEVVHDRGTSTEPEALSWRGMAVPVLVLGGRGEPGRARPRPSGRCLLVVRRLYGAQDSRYYAIEIQAPPRPLILEQDLLPVQGAPGDPGAYAACEFRMGGNSYFIPDMRAMEGGLLSP